MRAPLAACREPAGKLWQMCKVLYVFGCDQAALWMVQSVRPSFRPSIRLSVTPFWLCSHHRIIMKFSGVFFFFFFFYSQHKKRNKTRFLQRHPYNATWLAVRVFMFFHATLQHHIVSWWGHFPGQSGLVSWLPCYLLNFLDLGPGCIIYPAGTNRTDLHQKQTMVCKAHMVYHTQ